MTQRLKILIAGGGIGGLSAALALHRIGMDVTVLEASRQLSPLGLGINLLPHAVAVLNELGLEADLAALGVPTSGVVFANRHGQRIYLDARGREAGYATAQYSVHRGHFQMLLWRHVEQALGAEHLKLGHRLVELGPSALGIKARFETPQAAPVEMEADLLIGADGIHSRLRQHFYPDEGPPRWNGMMMWRGTTLACPFLDGRSMLQMGNRMAKFVAYPISAPDAQGLQLINWICDRRLREDGIGGGLQAPAREDWSRPGQLGDLLPTFEHWQFEGMSVGALLHQAQQILEWPMVDRDPLPRWSHAGSTLLGDAAHPMYPIGSNGATQAIMDAAALAHHLQAHTRLDDALQAYETERLPLCAGIVRMNRAEGLDGILDLVEGLAPDGFERIEDVIDPRMLAQHVARYKQAAGHHQSTSQNGLKTEHSDA